jgi:hypothetical protein
VAKPTIEDTMLYQSWIRKIVRHTGALPPSFVLDGVVRSGEHPVSGGGFSDIFMGTYKWNSVALKVLRMYGKANRNKEAFKVCFICQWVGAFMN